MKNYLKYLASPNVPSDVGEVFVNWEFPEYTEKRRSKAWYISVSVILALLILYAVLIGNYLFAIILVLGVFTVVYQYFEAPRSVPVVLAEDGIIIDREFFPYKAIKSFWLIYEPPDVKYLYLSFHSNLKRNLPIPLENANPLKIREALLTYLDEDLEKDEEEFSEVFSRMMNIH
ncbi:hypothetical protein HQ571_05250 [Candidatus Kuenenbacteria bacterium]|nr:hypothetical protein [Candidatus Kuenenbacteria bacterium]